MGEAQEENLTPLPVPAAALRSRIPANLFFVFLWGWVGPRQTSPSRLVDDGDQLHSTDGTIAGLREDDVRVHRASVKRCLRVFGRH